MGLAAFNRARREAQALSDRLVALSVEGNTAVSAIADVTAKAAALEGMPACQQKTALDDALSSAIDTAAVLKALIDAIETGRIDATVEAQLDQAVRATQERVDGLRSAIDAAQAFLLKKAKTSPTGGEAQATDPAATGDGQKPPTDPADPTATGGEAQTTDPAATGEGQKPPPDAQGSKKK